MCHAMIVRAKVVVALFSGQYFVATFSVASFPCLFHAIFLAATCSVVKIPWQSFRGKVFGGNISVTNCSCHLFRGKAAVAKFSGQNVRGNFFAGKQSVTNCSW